MPPSLSELVQLWDEDYESTLSKDASAEHRRPYSKVLEQLHRSSRARFEPFDNDTLPRFSHKLETWIMQFDPGQQRIAFLLGLRMVYVSKPQFTTLLRSLFVDHIQRVLADAVICSEANCDELDLKFACSNLSKEIDRTLVIPNTDSSPLNEFMHVNINNFKDYQQRNLVGPPVEFWVYAAGKSADYRRQSKTGEAELAERFEKDIMAKDKRLRNKSRLIVIEDFAGSGSNLSATVEDLKRTSFDFQEILIAPVMITEFAKSKLEKKCEAASDSNRKFRVVSAYVLKDKYRCFDNSHGTSFLDNSKEEPNLSNYVRDVSDTVYSSHFHSALDRNFKYGFGGLALAFAFFSNCPDNSLPIIWQSAESPEWIPLFPRASRIV